MTKVNDKTAQMNVRTLYGLSAALHVQVISSNSDDSIIYQTSNRGIEEIHRFGGMLVSGVRDLQQVRDLLLSVPIPCDWFAI